MSDTAFRLVSREEIKEINGIVSVYEHTRTGAALVHIGDDNPQKLFMIGFRTIPGDDTGVAHIMEHSVLCGSKKYPVKEPFVELMKGSLNTFLNAMTGNDCTMYPVMTPNLKDFNNLMDVYLDAVFNPCIYEKKEILMQEGWHYELDEQGALTINGVVYNEMKGAMSSPEEQLDQALLRTLFTTFYRHHSGGDPAAIPSLTQEQFEKFHQTHYHPGNSVTVIAGDMPIEPVLSHIDESFFSHYEKPCQATEIPAQPPLSTPTEGVFEYAVPEDQDDSGMTYLAADCLTCDAANREELLGVTVLAQILFGSEAAPVKKALLDAGVGRDVSAQMIPSKQAILKIVVSGAEPGDMDAFRRVMHETLTRLAEEGLEQKLVGGAINRYDFALREASLAGVNARIMSAIYTLLDWDYGAKIGSGMRYETELAAIRDKAAQGYFEGLIRKYLLENTSCAYVTLKPGKGLLAKLDAAERARLVNVLNAMSAQEIAVIQEKADRLHAWQQTPDTTEALAAIPRLTLADVEKKATPRPVTEIAQEGVPLLWHDAFTAGIAYVSAMFDMSALTPEEWKTAALLAFMLDKLGTKNRSYEELTKDIDLSTGGIAAECKAIRRRDGSVYSAFCASLRCVTDRLPEGLSLLADILTGANTENRARLTQLTRMLYASLQSQLQDNGNQYASYRNRSYFRAETAFVDAVEGLGFYDFIMKTARSLPEGADALAQKLSAVAAKLFTRENLTLALTGQKEQFGKLSSTLSTLTHSLREGAKENLAYAFTENIRNEGILSASMVQYVSQAYDYEKLGFPYSGKLLAVQNFLSSGYLWNNIRVQGGAYGALLMIRDDGVLNLLSYRDPNLKETLSVYRGIGTYLRTADFTKGDVENNVISAVADLDRPLPPFVAGEIAFKQHIAGMTQEEKQRERDELLAAGVADFRAAGDLFDAVVDQNCICVFGNADKLKANAGLFGSLIKAEEN